MSNITAKVVVVSSIWYLVYQIMDSPSLFNTQIMDSFIIQYTKYELLHYSIQKLWTLLHYSIHKLWTLFLYSIHKLWTLLHYSIHKLWTLLHYSIHWCGWYEKGCIVCITFSVFFSLSWFKKSLLNTLGFVGSVFTLFLMYFGPFYNYGHV